MKATGQYISNIRIVCSPRFRQRPLTCLRIPFPDFDAVIGRGTEDASAIEVDVEYSNPVMVARLEVANRRHILLDLRNMNKQGGIALPITADPLEGSVRGYWVSAKSSRYLDKMATGAWWRRDGIMEVAMKPFSRRLRELVHTLWTVDT
jgi:hypothetical protein